MASRYAVYAFCFHDSVANVDRFVEQGALRDSLEQAVVENPGAFQTTPLTVGTQIHPTLAGYLATYPRGPEIS